MSEVSESYLQEFQPYLEEEHRHLRERRHGYWGSKFGWHTNSCLRKMLSAKKRHVTGIVPHEVMDYLYSGCKVLNVGGCWIETKTRQRVNPDTEEWFDERFSRRVSECHVWVYAEHNTGWDGGFLFRELAELANLHQWGSFILTTPIGEVMSYHKPEGAHFEVPHGRAGSFSLI